METHCVAVIKTIELILSRELMVVIRFTQNIQIDCVGRNVECFHF
jgi:hypothetical protein